jgi:hypothetical protein
VTILVNGSRSEEGESTFGRSGVVESGNRTTRKYTKVIAKAQATQSMMSVKYWDEIVGAFSLKRVSLDGQSVQCAQIRMVVWAIIYR